MNIITATVPLYAFVLYGCNVPCYESAETIHGNTKDGIGCQSNQHRIEIVHEGSNTILICRCPERKGAQ